MNLKAVLLFPHKLLEKTMFLPSHLEMKSLQFRTTPGTLNYYTNNKAYSQASCLFLLWNWMAWRTSSHWFSHDTWVASDREDAHRRSSLVLVPPLCSREQSWRFGVSVSPKPAQEMYSVPGDYLRVIPPPRGWLLPEKELCQLLILMAMVKGQPAEG